MLTTYMNVNFNKMFETLIFQPALITLHFHLQPLMHSVCIKYTSHKMVVKSGGNSSEHYF